MKISTCQSDQLTKIWLAGYKRRNTEKAISLYSFLTKNQIMNCHTCIFVGNVPGSAHRSCTIPKLSGMTPVHELLLATGKITIQITDNNTGEKKNAVDIDPCGIENGWALWPLDFDPNWIRSCVFYKPKS